MQKRTIAQRTWPLLASAALFAGSALAGPLDSLQPGQWYEFPNSRIADVLPSPVPEGNPVAMLYYSGGAFDTRRNRLLVWGGGHAAYNGNEIYAFDVAAGHWSRLTQPTASPGSVHSYDQLEYLPRQDLLMAAGGSVWGDGHASNQTWLFDFTSNAWRQGANIIGPLADVWEYNMTTAYDPLSDQVLMAGYVAAAAYNAATDTWVRSPSAVRRDLGSTGALDPVRRQFVTIGRGTAAIHSVSASGAIGSKAALNATGATEIQACDAPGLDYDPASDRLVAWCGGSDVYSLNLDTRVWTRHTATNSVSPGDPLVQDPDYRGTFGRWRYMPAYNAFVLYSRVQGNVFVYKLSSGGGSTAPAAAAVSISASPTTVTSGGTTTLSWSGYNVSSCTASGAWSGARATSGQQALSALTATGTYTLTCTGTNGTASNAVTVTVTGSGGSTGGGTGGGTIGGDSGGGTTGGGTTGSSNPDLDWQARSHGPGVVTAMGFDTQSDWLSRIADTDGCLAAYAPGCRANAWDSSVKASGAGSVRFDIRSQTGQGAGGNVVVNFSPDNSVQFGANEEFWLQWRQRFDAYMIDHDYAETGGSGEWKQVIIAQGDRTLANGSILQGYACSEAQLVIQNVGGRDFPSGYIECGRYANFEQTLGTNDSGSTVITRQNAKGSTCIFFPRTMDTSGCLRYYPNEWMTFMVHLRMGPEGTAVSSVSGISQPGFINSTYDFYVARQGQPLELAHHQEGIVIPRGQFWNASTGTNPDNPDDPGYGNSGWSGHDAHPQAEYGKVWLTPYHTFKDPAEVTENASTWYDEVIVSTQSIPSPGGAIAPGTPAVTLTADPASITSGSTSNLTWSTQNVSSCTASGGWSGSHATSGQQTVGPLTSTTTYTLTCGSVSRSATVTVQGSGGGSGGGSGASYSLLFDVDDHADGVALNGSIVSGTGWVYVDPETGVSNVDFSIDGNFGHTESLAPYDLVGSTPFDFATLSPGSHTVTALIRTVTGEEVTVNATFEVSPDGGGSSGGSGSGSHSAPVTPVLAGVSGPLSPGDIVLDTASAYSDPDGDPMASAEWEIATDQNFQSLVLARLVPERSALNVPAGVLEPMRSYWMRTRYRDSRGATSQWSTPVAFTTAASAPGDADANGTEDASQVYGFADANGNGINDADEGICDLRDAEGSSVVGLESDFGNLQCFRTVAASEVPAPPSPDMTFPYGLFSFRIEGLRVDPVNPATVTVRVHLPARPAKSVRWYKHDPATGSLSEFDGHVTFEGNTALVELVDGGAGDFDGVVNGVIVDPSGPLTVPSSGGSSSIGLLLPTLMAATGVIRRRRVRRRPAKPESPASGARAARGPPASQR